MASQSKDYSFKPPLQLGLAIRTNSGHGIQIQVHIAISGEPPLKDSSSLLFCNPLLHPFFSNLLPGTEISLVPSKLYRAELSHEP